MTQRPIYIISPAYRHDSAGIVALHMLCHYLNLVNQEAYVVYYEPDATAQPPDNLLCPLAAEPAPDSIVIYPEIFDNPFKASFFGRYILNHPGKLSSIYTEEASFNFGYTKVLADSVKSKDVLFIPTCDLEFWYDAQQERDGSCYWANRLIKSGKQPENLSENCIQICDKDLMTKEHIRHIFQTTKTFYCYEDSALGLEAMLCGCKVIFPPSTFTEIPMIGSYELDFEQPIRPQLQKYITAAQDTVKELAAYWQDLATFHF